MRSKTTLTVTVLGGIAALALTGCTGTGGTASPTTGVSTTTATTSADTISNPLDTSKLQKDLCSGLTAQQVSPYVGTVRKNSVDTESNSTSCLLYPTDDNLATVSIVIYPNLTVSDMIATGANYPYSKNLAPVQGYQAQSTSQGNPPHGECATSAAVADHIVVSVGAQSTEGNPNYNNMCAVTEALLPMLVGNLKAAG